MNNKNAASDVDEDKLLEGEMDPADEYSEDYADGDEFGEAEDADFDSYDEDAGASAGKNKKKLGAKGGNGNGKKKSSNTLIIAGAVVLGLGVFWMQLSGGKKQAEQPLPQPAAIETPAQPAQQADNTLPRSPEAAPFAPNDAATVPQGGILDNPAAMDELVRQKREALTPPIVEVEGVPPMPAPIAPPTPDHEPRTVLTPLPEPAPASSPSLPNAQDIMLDPPLRAGQTPAADTQALGQKLDRLFERLDSVEEKISTLQSSAASGGNDVTGNVMAAIQKLESRIDDLEARPAPSSRKQPDQAPQMELKENAGTQNESYTPPESPKVSVPIPRRQAASAPVHWVLRSVAQDEVYVSKDGGEILHARVGETLAGVGKILRIEKENGRWIVHGTTGKITQ